MQNNATQVVIKQGTRQQVLKQVQQIYAKLTG
jgi:hypothetical protein